MGARRGAAAAAAVAAAAWCIGSAAALAPRAELELAGAAALDLAALAPEPPEGASPVTIVDCSSSVAAGVSVGLLNRGGWPKADCKPAKEPLFVWAVRLGLVARHDPPETVVQAALQAGLFNGTVLFDYGSHRGENLALSAAGIYDLLPVAEGDPVLAKLGDAAHAHLRPRFDFRKNRNSSLPGGYFDSFAGATQFTVEVLLPDSNRKTFCYRPANGRIEPLVAMERMVTVYVDDVERKCLEYNLTPTKTLSEIVARRSGLAPFLDLTSSSHWDTAEKALTMVGFAPGLVEATGWCTRDRTMGVTASDLADSLSLLKAFQNMHESQRISNKNRLKQNPAPKLKYNASKIYVAHVVSDGDNLSLLGSTQNYLEERRSRCAGRKEGDRCPPRSWTISGRTDIVSPALRSFYNTVDYDGATDSFLLPPSGASYFYPAAALDRRGLWKHHNATVQAAERLGIEATVIWDFCFEFSSKLHHEYVSSFIGTPIKAVFWSGAPWLLSPNEKYPFMKLGYKSDNVLRHPNDPKRGVILFNELTRWDGVVGNRDGVNGKKMSYAQMGKLVQQQRPGSLNFVYDISWSIHNDEFEAYAATLARDHPDVVLVDHRTLIDLAFQKYDLLDPADP